MRRSLGLENVQNQGYECNWQATAYHFIIIAMGEVATVMLIVTVFWGVLLSPTPTEVVPTDPPAWTLNTVSFNVAVATEGVGEEIIATGRVAPLIETFVLSFGRRRTFDWEAVNAPVVTVF